MHIYNNSLHVFIHMYSSACVPWTYLNARECSSVCTVNTSCMTIDQLLSVLIIHQQDKYIPWMSITFYYIYID